jgi:signal transduction histidine kinase
MLALSALATLVALALAGWAIGGVLERFVIAGLDQRLDAQVALLASAVDADGRIDRVRLDQRLGALQVGPGWRWRIVAPGGTIGSSDFPRLDERPPAPPPPPDTGSAFAGAAPGPAIPTDRLQPIDGGNEAGVRVHARRLAFATRGGLVELTAAAPREVVSRPIRGALMPLLAAMTALAALLGLATIVQLRVGLQPLRTLRNQIAAIRSGQRREVDEDQPSELRPLAVELNALGRDNVKALATARLSAANLAHALKTPVATLALDVRDEPARAEQVARIDATIRHHLARSRIEAGDHRLSTPLAPVVGDLLLAIERLHADKRLAFDVAVPADSAVAMDPQDLAELLGNLLENAAKYAAGAVGFVATERLDAREIVVEISDDGPGIAPAERTQVLQPGIRLDERAEGHGFGLSIAAELASLYGGRIDLGAARAGGLLVRVSIPLATGN